jgi:hypothetical protein
LTFATVLTSPLQRARRTGELAGFAECVHADPDLMSQSSACGMTRDIHSASFTPTENTTWERL